MLCEISDHNIVKRGKSEREKNRVVALLPCGLAKAQVIGDHVNVIMDVNRRLRESSSAKCRIGNWIVSRSGLSSHCT